MDIGMEDKKIVERLLACQRREKFMCLYCGILHVQQGCVLLFHS
ncbi:unnamed protein product [Larinioides sclopetarius]|uniref:Uncharacterized protein n=1 Tax=Larinioides sclopetarius TaxID=280406 RepID=A0AAV1Z744_9ARAC